MTPRLPTRPTRARLVRVRLWACVALMPAIVLPLTGGVPAPTFTLQGTIGERRFGNPVEGAEITLVQAARTVRADSLGRFNFGPLQIVGPEVLFVDHPEFNPIRIPLGSLTDGAWNLRITMVPRIDMVGGAPPVGPGVVR